MISRMCSPPFSSFFRVACGMLKWVCLNERESEKRKERESKREREKGEKCVCVCVCVCIKE